MSRRERVVFQEEGHRYFGERTKFRYESVSGVNKMVLAPEVDWEGIKERKAKKLGITPEELQERWSLAQTEGTKAGTAIHNAEESSFYEEDYYEWKGEKYKVVRAETKGDRKYQTLDLKPGHVYPECILSLTQDHMRIAGQSDALFVDKNNYVHLLDYKTDKELSFKGFTPYRGKEQGMKEPFGHIGDANFNHYTQKMGSYVFMALRANPKLKAGMIILEHIPIERDSNGLPVWGDGGIPTIQSRTEYEINYKDNEQFIKDVLNQYWKITK